MANSTVDKVACWAISKYDWGCRYSRCYKWASGVRSNQNSYCERLSNSVDGGVFVRHLF
ncbi:hypothetical protein [Spirosoma arcticum]